MDSFGTICGYAEHGAIVHYSATTETDATLKPEGLLLIDSGAQYLDGTTDITRTIALGEPTEQMKKDFTRVLKGTISLAKSKFPAGTRALRSISLPVRRYGIPALITCTEPVTVSAIA